MSLMSVNEWPEFFSVGVVGSLKEHEILKIGGGSYCHKLFRTMQQFQKLIDESGKEYSSPDYYSDSLDIMFDVLRVNDSEQCIEKKGRLRYYNPVISRELEEKRKIEDDNKHLYKSDFYLHIPSSLGCESLSDYSFTKYSNQAFRVLKAHVEKVPQWCIKHPNITRKGLLVVDISHVYSRLDNTGHIVIYRPWDDVLLMRQLIESTLDFVIWFFPHQYVCAFIDVRSSVSSLVRCDKYDWQLSC